MPPKKLPPKAAKQTQQSQNASKPRSQNTPATDNTKQAVPEHEVKKSSAATAQLALEAAKKAYELRQAAYGAGDPNVREEILAKAIDREIEAESFGKAAKYTRSGAFQGLAAGAGLGIQPGVTIGKLTGALVGGLVSSAGALLGGGIGSAYGAISGPFWDLGQMASHSVRNILGDFPNWEATPSQKKALDKMVMEAQQTKAPSQAELQEMREDDGGTNQADFQQFTQSLSSWIPNVPSMPSMPSMPSIPGFGGQSKGNRQPSAGNKTVTAPKSNQSQGQKAATKPPTAPKAQAPSPKTSSQTTKPQQPQKANETVVKKKPKKLEVRSTSSVSQPDQSTVRKAPPKLGPRRQPATAST